MSKERYIRQIIMPEIGERGQDNLLNAKVLVVGAGGLGSPILLYLAAAGIGTIGVVDNDNISISNLQRQILYTTPQMGEYKVDEASAHLTALNPNIRVKTYRERLIEENVEEIMKDYHIVIDATDNYSTRLLIDEYTAKLKIPYIYGSVSGFTGQVSIFNTGGAGRYKDLFPDIYNADDKQVVGVLGAVPGVIGSIQACEAVKLILNLDGALIGKLLVVNLLENKYDVYELLS